MRSLGHTELTLPGDLDPVSECECVSVLHVHVCVDTHTGAYMSLCVPCAGVSECCYWYPFVEQRLCGLWFCGSVAQWFCGSMAL